MKTYDELVARCDCIYSGDEVRSAISRMAVEIDSEMQGKNPLLICVMNGGLVFTGQLLPRLKMALQVDYLHATRYRGAERGGELHWYAKPVQSLLGRTVVIVDDILDEGLTLEGIVNFCRDEGAAEIKIAVLVEKKHGRNQTGIDSDYVGLIVPDRYVFGFGMDYDNAWRNVDGIYALK